MTMVITKIGKGYFLRDPNYPFGYPILASALRVAARLGYTHYELIGKKVKIIPEEYRANTN